jgi:excisionase family DNA binding protein
MKADPEPNIRNFQLAKLAYSKKEAAVATSLSLRTIQYLITQGVLRVHKIGKRVIIPSRELIRLVERGALVKVDAKQRQTSENSKEKFSRLEGTRVRLQRPAGSGSQTGNQLLIQLWLSLVCRRTHLPLSSKS